MNLDLIMTLFSLVVAVAGGAGVGEATFLQLPAVGAISYVSVKQQESQRRFSLGEAAVSGTKKNIVRALARP
ncbi:MAG: hypothetical protein H0W20_01095 [Chthoniobacterales bacterium]|nr:hypothetical protein [Chthoniobacterales bacterium]